MNKQAARQNAISSGYANSYKASYGYDSQPGFPGYGVEPAYGFTTPPQFFQEPWATTQWREYYIPTVPGGGKRPVIYVAVPLPAANPCGGLGGYGGGIPLF